MNASIKGALLLISALAGCESANHTTVADPSTGKAENDAGLGAFWCNPVGWADAGIIADLDTPDIGYAGIALQWASETKEQVVRRIPTQKSNELGRLVVGPRQPGKFSDVTYVVYRTNRGKVHLRQEPVDLTYAWAGMPNHMECEEYSRNSHANP